MRTESLSSLLVVGENQKLLGYVVADDAARLVKENITSLESIIRTDIPKVSKETLIHELYDVIYEAQTPVAVVDDNDKLLGIVVRGLVIGALAKEREEVTIDGE